MIEFDIDELFSGTVKSKQDEQEEQDEKKAKKRKDYREAVRKPRAREEHQSWEEFVKEQRLMAEDDTRIREAELDRLYGGNKSNLVYEGYINTQANIAYTCQGLRRVPVGKFLKLKRNSFLLYCALQKLSFRTEGDKERYIKEVDLNFSELMRMTGIKDHRTVKKKFSQLEIDCFITRSTDEIGGTIFKLPLIGDFYVLIDLEVQHIKSILELCNENLLRVMLFHKSYQESMKRRGKSGAYTVTLEYICECIGLSAKSRANISKIIACNNVLEKLGNIKIEKRWEKKEGSTVERNYYKFNI